VKSLSRGPYIFFIENHYGNTQGGAQMTLYRRRARRGRGAWTRRRRGADALAGRGGGGDPLPLPRRRHPRAPHRPASTRAICHSPSPVRAHTENQNRCN
jgi:hypothetical protein